jgi:hypothetical protein
MRKRALIFVLLAAFVPGCATDGATSVGVGFYGDWYYGDDIWYGGGCCVDVPPGSGARPEHPIALPPDGVGPPRPEQPIALPAEPKSTRPGATSSSSSNRSAAPRMSAMPRGGGGRGGRR